MILVFDTSSLVKRYIAEPGSDVVDAGWDAAWTRCASWVVEAEMLATFARKRREGVLAAGVLVAARQRFSNDWSAMHRIEPSIISSYLPALHDRYALRGADSIHLATALQVRVLVAGIEVRFATTDQRLAQSAQAEQLLLLN